MRLDKAEITGLQFPLLLTHLTGWVYFSVLDEDKCLLDYTNRRRVHRCEIDSGKSNEWVCISSYYISNYPISRFFQSIFCCVLFLQLKQFLFQPKIASIHKAFTKYKHQMYVYVRQLFVSELRFLVNWFL